MKIKTLVLAAVLVIPGLFAQASSFDNRHQSEFKTLIGPVTLVTENYVSWSEISFDGAYAKIIVEAQEDAAAFVASNGEVLGAQLSQALRLIKEKAPETTSTDMDLAIAIINAAPR